MSVIGKERKGKGRGGWWMGNASTVGGAHSDKMHAGQARRTEHIALGNAVGGEEKREGEMVWASDGGRKGVETGGESLFAHARGARRPRGEKCLI